ncbi:MAG: GNAT family N-acetyltransferase [Dehalococcoidia bacterium]
MSIGAIGGAQVATRTDVSALSDVLAAAFEGHPLTEWVVRQDAKRAAARRLYFDAYLRHGLADGEVVCDDDRRAAAIWFPPDGWRSGVATMAARLPVLARITGVRSFVSRVAQLRRLADHHSPAPHWYLEVLGTHPAHQRAGLASALVEAGLARARDAGVGAYLLTSNREVVPFYERFGFKLHDDLRIPGGPSIWSLWMDVKGQAEKLSKINADEY